MQLGEKTRALVGQIDKIRTTEVESELEALLLEAYYIKKYNPRYNIRLTDNKAYILIRITGCHSERSEGSNSRSLAKAQAFSSEAQARRDDKIIIKDEYPIVTLARKGDDPTSIYFGPYPSSSMVKQVLKLIRRAFPFQSVANHPKRVCLYHHLGLCPCPPMFDSPELKKEYRKNIRNVIRVLEGKSKTIIKELEVERDIASAREEYEIALEEQRKINALSYITQPFRKPREYELNPNLRVDIRRQELESLQHILTANGCPIDYPGKIECYDISNIQGTNAVGSMVVFVDGEKESALYRRYKIRREFMKRTDKREMPNDFAMMQEVLTRRIKHEEWEYPQLLIVDGGKGQVTSALKALHEAGVVIPLVGLAKREETIIIPLFAPNSVETTGEFQEVSLPKDSGALQLMMRLRDEAHRFAITYHRNLRSKAALSSLEA